MKIKLSAVIPTTQYGNIQPEFEIDENDISNGKGFEFIESKIQAVWDKYGERPLVSKSGNSKRIKAFVGGEIDYDAENHTYSWNGEKYLSGSEYAKSKQKPFDSDRISKAMGDKFNVKPEDIQAMWTLKSDVSKGFGTALHAALELYGKYNGLAAQIEKETHIHDHPVIKKAVEGFYMGRENEKAEYEIFVVDHGSKRAGTIDRLVINAPKTCIVEDYKTNVKEDISYWKDQLDFYAGILEANGWKVEKKRIHHWTGEWRVIEV